MVRSTLCSHFSPKNWAPSYWNAPFWASIRLTWIFDVPIWCLTTGDQNSQNPVKAFQKYYRSLIFWKLSSWGHHFTLSKFQNVTKKRLKMVKMSFFDEKMIQMTVLNEIKYENHFKYIQILIFEKFSSYCHHFDCEHHKKYLKKLQKNCNFDHHFWTFHEIDYF